MFFTERDFEIKKEYKNLNNHNYNKLKQEEIKIKKNIKIKNEKMNYLNSFFSNISDHHHTFCNDPNPSCNFMSRSNNSRLL